MRLSFIPHILRVVWFLPPTAKGSVPARLSRRPALAPLSPAPRPAPVRPVAWTTRQCKSNRRRPLFLRGRLCRREGCHPPRRSRIPTLPPRPKCSPLQLRRRRRLCSLPWRTLNRRRAAPGLLPPRPSVPRRRLRRPRPPRAGTPPRPLTRPLPTCCYPAHSRRTRGNPRGRVPTASYFTGRLYRFSCR